MYVYSLPVLGIVLLIFVSPLIEQESLVEVSGALAASPYLVNTHTMEKFCSQLVRDMSNRCPGLFADYNRAAFVDLVSGSEHVCQISALLFRHFKDETRLSDMAELVDMMGQHWRHLATHNGLVSSKILPTYMWRLQRAAGQCCCGCGRKPAPRPTDSLEQHDVGRFKPTCPRLCLSICATLVWTPWTDSVRCCGRTVCAARAAARDRFPRRAGLSRCG